MTHLFSRNELYLTRKLSIFGGIYEKHFGHKSQCQSLKKHFLLGFFCFLSGFFFQKSNFDDERPAFLSGILGIQPSLKNSFAKQFLDQTEARSFSY